jgi:hypothetical protein
MKKGTKIALGIAGGLLGLSAIPQLVSETQTLLSEQTTAIVTEATTEPWATFEETVYWQNAEPATAPTTEAPTAPLTTTTEPTTEPTTTTKPTTTTGRTVYITPTGDKYHYLDGCGNGSYSPISLAEAIERGYGPCAKCVHN